MADEFPALIATLRKGIEHDAYRFSGITEEALAALDTLAAGAWVSKEEVDKVTGDD